MKKVSKILIVFPDQHLAYSPTILNLFRNLQHDHQVKLLSFDYNGNKLLSDPGVIYISFHSFLSRLILFIAFRIFGIKDESRKKDLVLSIRIHLHLFFNTYNHLLLTDLHSNHFTKSIHRPKKHLVSLELGPNTSNYRKTADFKQFHSILTQNNIRLKELLKENSCPAKVFFIPNSTSILLDKKERSCSSPLKLVYSGTIQLQFGIPLLIQYLREEKNVELLLIGNIAPNCRQLLNESKDLIQSGRLKVNEEYLKNEQQLLEKIATSDIGFCIYDLSFPEINNFNYITGPSGKIYSYMAASVPVIVNNVPGLAFIGQELAGAVISELKTSSLRIAIEHVQKNYVQFSSNAYNIARRDLSGPLMKQYSDYIKEL